MKLHNIDQLSEDWNALRLGRFTSSKIYLLFVEPKSKKDREAGNISESAKTYITDKATEIVYNCAPNSVSSFATEWGIDNEPLAKHEYERRKLNFISKCGFFELDSNTGSSPDGLIGKDGLIEIKCPFNRSNHIKNVLKLKDDLDLYKLSKMYYYQVHHQLYVTGRKWCDFVSFDPRLIHTNNNDKALHTIRIFRNEELCKLFEDKIKVASEYRDYLVNQILG